MPQAIFKPKPQEQEEEQPQTQKNEPLTTDISENFSQNALKSIKEALILSARFKNEQATPLHILKSLTTTSEIQGLLTNLNIDRSAFDNTISLALTPGNTSPRIVLLSVSSKKMLILAHQIAIKSGSGRVENSHLFYSCLLAPDVADLIVKLNINLSKLEEFLTKSSSTPTTLETPSLNRLSEDLTLKSLKTPLNLVGRKSELESIIRILIRRERSNVLLVGEVGIGKTAIVESLAQNLQKFDSPTLKQARVKLLDVATLFASPQYINTNGPKIIEEASSTNNKMILVFDKISYLQNQGQIGALNNFLSQLLKNSNISIILVTTPSFYNEYLKGSSLITNSFEKITIEEPSQDITIEILKTKIPQIESYHGVKLEGNIIKTAADLAKRYITSSFLPQKAIDLLEETAVQAAMKKQRVVTENDIKILLSEKTGIPLANITISEKEKLTNLEAILSQSVIGQDEAVRKVAQAIRRARAGLKDTKKPIGSFLFLGPTGVGKTETAKTLARTIYNDEKAFVRLDMSEYSEAHTTQRLIGSPPGYVGYEEGGQLTNPILERPYSLILLDEIEKAHPKVFDIFLQVLDDGRLTDAQGKTVDFKNTIVIATSNIATEKLLELSPEELQSFDKKKFFDNILLPELLKYFRPEFINRFDEIVIFNPLTTKELVQIARLKIASLEKRLKEKDIKLEVSDAKLEELVQASYDPSFGARPLERIIREKLENEIAKKLIDGSLAPGSTVKWE